MVQAYAFEDQSQAAEFKRDVLQLQIGHHLLQGTGHPPSIAAIIYAFRSLRLFDGTKDDEIELEDRKQLPILMVRTRAISLAQEVRTERASEGIWHIHRCTCLHFSTTTSTVSNDVARVHLVTFPVPLHIAKQLHHGQRGCYLRCALCSSTSFATRVL